MCVGGFCGYSVQGEFKDCESFATIEDAFNRAGGFTGYDCGGAYINCSNYGSLKNESSFGGIVGQGDYTEFYNCLNKGQLLVEDGGMVGGICGNSSAGIIENCTNEGAIKSLVVNSSGHSLGGVCGIMQEGTIKNCINKGEVKGDSNLGGIVGRIDKSFVYDSANFANVSGFSSVDGSVGGIVGYCLCGVVERSYNIGRIFGCCDVGGICGSGSGNTTTITKYIKDCYNTGDIISTKEGRCGGICGFADVLFAGISNYNIGDINGGAISRGTGVGAICGKVSEQSLGFYNCYYLEHSAVGSEKEWQNGLGSDTNGQVKEDTAGTVAVSYEQIKNGEVAYLLNSYAEMPSDVWGQDLSVGGDKHPVLKGKKVYLNTDEAGNQGYGNNDEVAVFNESEQITSVAATKLTAEKCEEYAIDLSFEGFYAISDEQELYWFCEQVNAGNVDLNGVLVDDIIVNEKIVYENGMLLSDVSILFDWTPIGNVTNKFKGVFDGNGYTISGLYISAKNQTEIGFFGYVNGAEIRNLSVENSFFMGFNYVGGICGRAEEAVIVNCSSDALVKAVYSCAGGIAGQINKGQIKNCNNKGEIQGWVYGAGGICGEVLNSDVIACNNSGKVFGNEYIGGISGRLFYEQGTMTECENTAFIEGVDYVGGISGLIQRSLLTYSKNSGTVVGRDSVGGVCGTLRGDDTYWGTVRYCENHGNVHTLLHNGGGVCGFGNCAAWIEDSYNTGLVYGCTYIGGIIGSGKQPSFSYNGPQVKRSYNKGMVKGDYYTGGVCGDASYCGIENCYYLLDCVVVPGASKQNGIGTTENSALLDKAGQTDVVALDDFSNGRLAFELQFLYEAATLDGGENVVWGQSDFGPGSHPVLVKGDGRYRVVENEDGSLTVAGKGDLNGNGQVDINDFQSGINLVLKEEDKKNEGFFFADMNDDDVLDVLDVSLIERKVRF